MNLLHFMWLSYSFIVTFSGMNFLFATCLPQFLRQLHAFGKVHNALQRQEKIVKKIEVPKRWFSHFYIFASLFIPSVTVVVCLKYFGICSCSFLNAIIDIFSASNRYNDESVCPESVILVGILLSFHVLRRCYECLFISVYSDSKMNIFHYIVGLTFYFGVGLSIVHDAPGFGSDSNQSVKVYVTGQWFLWRHIIGILLFMAAFFLQFETHKLFAALRKKDGNVVSFGHFMPEGGAFKYISCPHYFAEIIMYLSAALIFSGKSYTWWLACLWVVTNQVINGIISHQWYQEKFKDYPLERKAVIPFLL